jgi:hypothetical protein
MSESAVEESEDGYIWKYLYTISPSEVLKFDGTNYISIPNNWDDDTKNTSEIQRIKNAAVDGQIETILILKSTAYAVNAAIPLNNVPIKGDGTGGYATVEFDESLKPIKVTVTSYGSGYTFGTLDLDSMAVPLDEKSIFDVIIPPPGGHGKNVYTELGANKVLMYSRIENTITDPDFIEGNQFCRVGVVRNITSFGSNGSLFTNDTGSGTFGLLIDSDVLKPEDSLITQEETNAAGILVSKIPIGISSTFIKYINTKENYQDTYTQSNITKTSDPFEVNNYSGLSAPITSSYQYANFNSSEITITGTQYTIYNFSGSQIEDTYLGQSFTAGLSNPDINTKSGEIVYVDNRVSVTRQSQQREDIKIIIEF